MWPLILLIRWPQNYFYPPDCCRPKPIGSERTALRLYRFRGLSPAWSWSAWSGDKRRQEQTGQLRANLHQLRLYGFTSLAPAGGKIYASRTVLYVWILVKQENLMNLKYHILSITKCKFWLTFSGQIFAQPQITVKLYTNCKVSLTDICPDF